jgi:hypothetical protein
LSKPWNGLPVASELRVSIDGTRHQVRLLHRGWFRNLTIAGSLELSTWKAGVVGDQLTVCIDGIRIVLDVPKGLEQVHAPVSAAY